jgi:DNA-binding NarL/FixJ family response regulator
VTDLHAPPAIPSVVVVNEFDLVADGVRSLLATRPEVSIALDQSLDSPADIVLVDTYGAGPGAADLLESLAVVRPDRAVVVYTFGADRGYTDRALAAGVRGVVWKGAEADVLVDCLLRVARGETVVELPVGLSAPPRPACPWPFRDRGLSLRESEVLAHVVAGRSNREIAEALYVGAETVKTHVRSVLRKLGVANRTEATWAALQSDQLQRNKVIL